MCPLPLTLTKCATQWQHWMVSATTFPSIMMYPDGLDTDCDLGYRVSVQGVYVASSYCRQCRSYSINRMVASAEPTPAFTATNWQPIPLAEVAGVMNSDPGAATQRKVAR